MDSIVTPETMIYNIRLKYKKNIIFKINQMLENCIRSGYSEAIHTETVSILKSYGNADADALKKIEEDIDQVIQTFNSSGWNLKRDEPYYGMSKYEYVYTIKATNIIKM